MNSIMTMCSWRGKGVESSDDLRIEWREGEYYLDAGYRYFRSLPKKLQKAITWFWIPPFLPFNPNDMFKEHNGTPVYRLPRKNTKPSLVFRRIRV